MSHAIIASIYEAKLIAWNNARLEKLKIVFENMAYTPATGETYLRRSPSRATRPATRSAETTGCIPACSRSALFARQAQVKQKLTLLRPRSSRYFHFMCVTKKMVS